MIAVLTASRIADSRTVDPTANSTSSSGANSVNKTSGISATSAFERLLLQQIGVSLPPQSAYHEPPEKDAPQSTKGASADQTQTPPLKSKADENTTAINFFFMPTLLLRDIPSAKTADLHSVTSGAGDAPQPQNDKVTESNPPLTTIKSKTTTDTSTSKASDSPVGTIPAETDTPSTETVKQDPNPTVTNGQADLKNLQPPTTEPIPVALLQAGSSVTPPLVQGSIGPGGSSITDLKATGGTKFLFESAVSTSILVQESRSSPIERDPSNAGSQDESSSESNQPSLRDDSGGISTTALVPNIAGMTEVRFSNPESTSTISSQLSTAIVDHLNDAPTEGPTTVRIRLEKQDLGAVDLHLSVHDGIVSIRIAAADPLTQQLIDGQMDDLRHSLNQRGVNWGEMLVTGDGRGQQFAGNGGDRPGTVRVTPAFRAWRSPGAGTGAPSPRSTSALNYVA